MLFIVLFFILPVVFGLCFFIIEAKKEAEKQARLREKEAEWQARRREREAEKQAQKREIERKRKDNLFKFRQKIFPIVSSDVGIQTIWNHWKLDIHNTNEQLNLQVKAIYEAIPILINTKDFNGLFISLTTEFYETTLVSCSCPNFRIKGWPCLHMYRLFYELSNEGNRNSKITDIDSILLSRFYKLDEEERKHFVDTIQYMDDDGVDKYLPSHQKICKEIDIGLLMKSEVEDYAGLLTHMTKDELILALAKNGIQGFRPSWSKVRLIAWTVENHQDFLRKYFKQYAHVSASPSVLSWGKGIQQSRDMWTVTHPYSWDEVVRNI